jgi:hypothetical protein
MSRLVRVLADWWHLKWRANLPCPRRQHRFSLAWPTLLSSDLKCPPYERIEGLLTHFGKKALATQNSPEGRSPKHTIVDTYLPTCALKSLY